MSKKKPRSNQPRSAHNKVNKSVSSNEKKVSSQFQEELDLSKENAELVARITKRVVQTTIAHSGPLPNTQSFEEYERICPGAADRIIGITEFEQRKEAREMELYYEAMKEDRQVVKLGIESSSKNALSGQRTFAYLVTLFFISTGVFAVLGLDPSIIFSSGALAALTLFYNMYSSQRYRSERKVRRESIEDSEEKASSDLTKDGETDTEKPA